MNKIASYLQSHLSGEVYDDLKMRQFFATDASVLEIRPSLVIFPKTTSDVRKVARFSWQLAEKGHVLPITPRGAGNDETGGAIGSGIILSFTAHLDKILEIDTQQRLIRVQPGVNVKALQDLLLSHGLFLPPLPVHAKNSTIGGMMASDTSGEKSVKYGSMLPWVDKLEVVLANGEVIQTGRISRREVEKKKGLATLEGDIYRAVDGVISEKSDVVNSYYENLKVGKYNVGYNLRDVKKKDGSLDLTPLFVGSQGTLGVITEAILRVAIHPVKTDVLAVALDEMKQLIDILPALKDLRPSMTEIIDRNFIDLIMRQRQGLIPSELVSDEGEADLILFVEFDDMSTRTRARKIKKAKKILQTSNIHRVVVAEDESQQDNLWAIRYMTSIIINHEDMSRMSLPILSDASVPLNSIPEMLENSYKMSDKYDLSLVFWGHIGDDILRTRPFLDLSKLGDRQKVFRIIDEYCKMIVGFGGSIASRGSEGRLLAPFSKIQLGEELSEAMREIKDGFDPKKILNTGVKFDTNGKDLITNLRKDYSLTRTAGFLPRS